MSNDTAAASASASGTTASTSTSVAPTDDQVLAFAEALRADAPGIGAPKILARLRSDRPEWVISEKRLRKVLNPDGGANEVHTNGQVVVGGGGKAGKAGKGGKGKSAKGGTNGSYDGIIPSTGLDPTLDEAAVRALAPKVQVKVFEGGKGKGLVARERIERGEVVWGEGPWVVTADPDLYDPIASRRMCAHCFTLFDRPLPPMSVPCNGCQSVQFCNRLCQSRATAPGGSHPPLLCTARYPPARELQDEIRRTGARHFDAVVKILAAWRGAASAGEARAVGGRVWEGMARVNQVGKERERREWPVVGEQRLAELHAQHALVCRVLDPQPGDAGFKAMSKLSRRPHPLPDAERERWFSFDAFCELLGLAGLNQESSGGLYALHAHLNHSCEPNVQVRNLPKTFTPPQTSQLPCDLPPPSGPGVSRSNRLTMLARETIEKGQELTIPYVNFAAPRDERRQALRENYGFWCACPKCEREK